MDRSDLVALLHQVEEKLVYVLGRPTTSVWIVDTLGPVTQKLTKVLDEEWWPRPTENEERME